MTTLLCMSNVLIDEWLNIRNVTAIPYYMKKNEVNISIMQYSFPLITTAIISIPHGVYDVCRSH